MDIGADARFLSFGNRAFVAGSESDKAYVIDAAVLADRVLPKLGFETSSSPESERSTLDWYLRRASAVRFADIDDDDGVTRKNFAKASARPAPSVAVHEPPADESILELLRIGTSRSVWVAQNWPDSAPESFSMSFGRAFRYVVTCPATEFAPSDRSLWIVTEDGPTRVAGLPTWGAALPVAAMTNLQVDVCADLEVYARRYRHEFALQTLLVEAGRIAGDLMSGAARAGWNVISTTFVGEPVWKSWLESHAVVHMVRLELSGRSRSR